MANTKNLGIGKLFSLLPEVIPQYLALSETTCPSRNLMVPALKAVRDLGFGCELVAKLSGGRYQSKHKNASLVEW